MDYLPNDNPSQLSPPEFLTNIMKDEPSSCQQELIHDMVELNPIFDNISLTRRIIDLLLIDSKIGQSRLLSLALTCKAFSDPALDTLWESMNSLMPLLKLLSPFKLIDGFYVFRGPFDDQNLRRFDVYSRRVKKLTVSRDCSNVAPSTFIRLAQLRPLLLPALEELNSPSTSENETNILLFLSSNLKRLNVGGDEATFKKLISPALSMIAYESKQENPVLTHLTLRGEPPSLMQGLLGRFSNIRHLSISKVLDSNNFREIGELPNLESAIIILPASLSFDDEDLGFTKLRSLSITSSFPSLLLVLGKISTPNLESITVFANPTIRVIYTEPPAPVPQPAPARPVKNRPNRSGWSDPSHVPPAPAPAPEPAPPPRLEAPNNWQALVKLINSRWSSTLQSITLIQNNLSAAVLDPAPPNLFSGLPPFQSLEELKIQNWKFFPCDEGIHSLALACPNLTVLHLPLESLAANLPTYTQIDLNASRSNISTTIVALWSLCDLCTRLEDLQISLNVATLPSFPDATIRTHHLSQLSVSSQTISTATHSRRSAQYEHYLNIARHIDRLFPYLETIVCGGQGADIWDKVRPIQSAYKMVRSDDSKRRLPPEVKTRV